MTEPSPRRIIARRAFDFLAIVGVAATLLGLAWQVGKVTSANQFYHDAAPNTAVKSLPDTPELELQLPLHGLGMELTREQPSGGVERATAHLELRCREVLAESDHWVLSLAISEEERKFLDSISTTSPIESKTGPAGSQLLLFPLEHPTGRVGVRELASPAGEAAVAGRRLLCWGFIMGEGTESQTVWFARPRQKLPERDSLLPSVSSPSSPHQGHAP